ncbi:MAG: ABC transporter substrate-binding protein [Anaerolineae bacterium]
MRDQLRSWVVALILSSLLQGCGLARQAGTQPELIPLKLVLQPYLGYACFFIAQEEGYFTEQGLEVEFVQLKQGTETIPLLVSGEVDAAMPSINAGLLNAMAQGAKVRVVASGVFLPPGGCASAGFVARRALVESGALGSPQQLKGMHVAVRQDASVDAYRLQKLLDLANLTMADIEPVEVSSAALVDAFAKGTVDVVGTSEPWITRLVAGGNAVLWKPAQELLPDFDHGLIVYGPNLLTRNPEAGKRLMVALLKAQRRYSEGPTERNLEIMAKYTGLDRALLLQACWPESRSDGRINVQSVLGFQDWALRNGYLDKAAGAEQIWDPTFVDYANQILQEKGP